MDENAGQRKIVATLLQCRTAHNFLSRTQAGDLGAHQRPVDQIVAQHGEPRVIAGSFQIRVEQTPGEVRSLTIVQIHHQKCDFADDVDPAQVVVEFDAVERCNLSLEQRQIAQMQVAVAFADEPLLFAL